MKEMTSLNIIESSGIYDDYKKKPVRPGQKNCVLTKKLYYGRKTQKNSLQSRTDATTDPKDHSGKIDRKREQHIIYIYI